MRATGPRVAVIGGGVVGCAVAHALARRGVGADVLEAEPGLALGASGTNSGILHTGFDSIPGELETRLLLRGAELREQLLGELGVAVRRCGARLEPQDEEERSAVRGLAANAALNGVEVALASDGALSVPGETITDPVAFVYALAGAAQAGGATVELGARVSALAQAEEGISLELASGERRLVRAAVNCAGLHADEVAELANEHPVSVYPRKGEFLVFAPPADEPLENILLPVPSALGKGVLVFPTLDGEIVAGPTAREREDKHDWSVEEDAADLILARALRMYPPLERARRIGAYAGLRPAGRDRNYVIEASRTVRGLVHVAAIRSTGLSASLGIGEHVAAMLARLDAVELGPVRPLEPPAAPAGAPAPGRPPRTRAAAGERWWERTATHHRADPERQA